MKSWLRFFGLSFFSDKISKEARIRGLLNCVLGFIFAILFIFCGVLAANTIPFYSHYNKAARFKDFLYNAVEVNELTVKEGQISAENVINTFLEENSDNEYGYNLVIDTRPSETLDDFEAYCVSKKGNDEISYEDYLALSEEDKSGFEFKIRYTPNELILTDEMISGFEKYLNSSEDQNIKKQYSELDATAEGYKNKVYALYVKAYYPEITSYERVGEVPLVRSYYYRNYLNRNDIKNSLFVFDDVLFGFFETDGGVEVTFYGSYKNVADGKLTKDNVDRFIKDSFSSSVSVSVTVYLMNVVKFIPVIVFIPLILALIAKIVLKLIKDDKYKKYSTCFKIVCSYLFVGTLLSALILFICGFFVSSTVLNVLPLAVFTAILTVRTAILLVSEYIQINKIKKENVELKEEEK